LPISAIVVIGDDIDLSTQYFSTSSAKTLLAHSVVMLFFAYFAVKAFLRVLRG
jgi:hypothetical protein